MNRKKPPTDGWLKLRWRGFYHGRFIPRYNQLAPLIVIFCVATSTFSSLGVFIVYTANEANRTAIVKNSSDILDCVNKYNNQLYFVNKILRKATVQEANARAKRDRILDEALVYSNTGGTDPEVRARLSRKLTRAQHSLVREQTELRVARKEHPVPKPPEKQKDCQANFEENFNGDGNE